jgi:integrase
MKTHNPGNERVKREYFAYLKEAKRYSEASLDGVAKALNRFETYTKFRDFKAFHINQAMAFKKHLADQRNARTREALSKATLYSTLTALKNFFQWLAGRPGYKSHFTYADAEYFNLSDNETRIAKARREQSVPTLEQIAHVIRTMPTATEIEHRNRAVVAFIALTGTRDGAVASLKLKHIDIIENVVHQDGREVKTKRRKSFSTWFFPVGDDIRQIMADWVEYLRSVKLWGMDDPLFPATRMVVGASRRFEVAGFDRKHWSNATPIRAIFKDAFERAGLPSYPPHSFRKTLAQLGETLCRNPEEFKAWSQNLGHEQVITTFTSYGAVATRRQAAIIRDLGRPRCAEMAADETTLKALRVLREAGMLESWTKLGRPQERAATKPIERDPGAAEERVR